MSDAILVIGLKYRIARAGDAGARDKTCRTVFRLLCTSAERDGSVNCTDLIE